MAIMEDFIVAYGDDIDVVYCHWDVGATGCIEALKNAGMTVYMLSASTAAQLVMTRFVKVPSTEYRQSFSQMTRDAFDNITKILNGEEYEEVVWTALDIVTIDTIDNFPYPEW